MPNGATWVLLQGKQVISVACGAEHTLAALETGEVTFSPELLRKL